MIAHASYDNHAILMIVGKINRWIDLPVQMNHFWNRILFDLFIISLIRMMNTAESNVDNLYIAIPALYVGYSYY